MRKLLIIVTIFMTFAVKAQVSLYEQEPNNTPITGNKFEAPMIVFGSILGKDQDMFIWQVTEADAAYFWGIELDGLPDRLTRLDFMHLTFTEDGSGVRKVDKIFSVKAHGGMSTVKKTGLVVSPGNYYIGLSYAGGNNESVSPLLGDKMLGELGDEYVKDNQRIDQIKVTEQMSYQLKINKGKKLPSLAIKKSSKDNPTLLRKNSLKSIYFDDKNKWLSVDFNEKEAQLNWEINGNVVIGESLKLNFYDSNGEIQANSKSDDYGHFSLSDLNLPPGKYLIELISRENAITSIEIKDVGLPIQGQEAEPNDYFKSANQFSLEKKVSGQMGKANEYDYYKFNITEELSQDQLEIQLSNSEDTKLELCLYNEDKVRLQCKTNKGDINLIQLVLPSGTYGISVARGVINTQYTLDVINKGKRKSLIEAEPNDKFVHATAMNSKRIIKGVISGKEADFFAFEVSEQEQMWKVQVVGESITNLAIYNAAGDSIQEQRFNKGRKRVRLSNLQLMPGKHVIRVYGENSRYLLRAFPTGPIDPSLETEPNDKKPQSIVLDFNQTKKGLLQNLTDKDMYRFHLNNEQGVHLSIQAPIDGRIRYHLQWEGMRLGRKTSEIGGLLEYKGVLPAGDYDLQLKAEKSPSDDLYKIDLKYYDDSACIMDCEPNDNVHQANVIKAPMKLVGKTGSHEDYDWYQLPAFATETLVTFENNQEKKDTSTRAFIKFDKSIKSQFDLEKKQTSFLIPANEKSYYRLEQVERNYNWTVLINNEKVAEALINSDLHIQLQNMPNKVKAYSPYTQNLSAELSIENKGTKAQSFNILSKINDHRWQVQLDETTKEIQPGAKVTLPIVIKVAANTQNNQQVRIGLIAKDKDLVLSQTWQDVKTDIDAVLIQPSQYWSLNDELLGGINVAASALGGQRTEQDLAFNVNAVGTGFDKLFDGFTATGLGMQYRGGRKTQQDFITIQLAGNKLIDVKGIILNPLSKVKPNLYLKDFDLHLSTDGVDFQSVLKGQVKTVNAEQSFVLDKIVPAKFARLYLLNSHENRNKSNTGLGEWKVIASPTQRISKVSGFNIADPKLGGHVAWANPESSGKWDINILTEKQEKKYARSTNNNDWQWVVGFHNQRAAKITKIQLQPSQVDISGKSNYELLKNIKVFASINSNVGPWKLIAEKGSSSVNESDEIILENPVWARYVKFSTSNVKLRNYAYFPETIKIFEQLADKNYQSILGEWGELSESSFYEKSNPVQNSQYLDDKNNNSKQSAIDLTGIHTASGQVQLELADKPDWYKYIPAKGDNTLSISLSGKQTIETIIEVEDNLGTNLPLIPSKNKTNKLEYQIPIDSAKQYYLRVEEPPRSVIFSWDTSGSTQAYEPMIYNAISSYSNNVIAGRDTVNFLPFGGELLMEDWYGKAYYLKTILNNYQRKDNSSEAEKTLMIASKALKNRQGSKSIIVITDAITGKKAQMWDTFREVHPRIFSIGIIGNGFGGNPNRQIDLMQSWSRVNNGDFQKVVTATEVEQAFERIAIKLRQPADYTLSINSEFIKIPGPGKLQIQQDDSQASSAVELILDASGSMLKRLDGKRRINIAKEVLVKAVTEIIPEKTPLALRVFGDKQANSCRTDLAIKLGPLNREKAKSTINKIYAKNLAKTPIADSLSKVASDLKAHKGKKIVILVTDGEETCDGNPQEVIAKLIDDGIDIRLNIVGFAIDDETLKGQFNQWSTQGGGKYFDSNNPESLKESVSQALKTPYSVYSTTSELIQEGFVNGDAIELPAGYYTIKVFDNEVKTYQNYKIKGESTQLINISVKE